MFSFSNVYSLISNNYFSFLKKEKKESKYEYKELKEIQEQNTDRRIAKKFIIEFLEKHDKGSK